MNVLSLFSGVGGFDLGLENAGMKTIYQCEWDKHATGVLELHWPHVPRWGDITTLTGKEILSHGTPPDVVAWGSPCQDLSVANGNRTGLGGSRSGLFYEGIRIINEIRKETNNEYPKFSIWENVAGSLTSNRGADFGVILDEMANAGSVAIEWAVVDAQHWVAQRRKRVFVVATFDPVIAHRSPSPILSFSESLPRDTKKSIKAREKAAGATGDSVAYTKSRRAQSVDDFETWVEGDVSPTLNQFDVGDIRTTTAVTQLVLFENSYRDGARIADSDITQTLTAKMGTGGGNTPMVAYSVREDSKSFSATPIDKSLALQTMRMSPSSHHAQTVITQNTVVRRLTPDECCLLMGWPLEWNKWKSAGSTYNMKFRVEQSDSARYKQIGNGVASPVAEWIGKQLMKLETSLEG